MTVTIPGVDLGPVFDEEFDRVDVVPPQRGNVQYSVAVTTGEIWICSGVE